jgi:hypothetical protein
MGVKRSWNEKEMRENAALAKEMGPIGFAAEKYMLKLPGFDDWVRRAYPHKDRSGVDRDNRGFAAPDVYTSTEARGQYYNRHPYGIDSYHNSLHQAKEWYPKFGFDSHSGRDAKKERSYARIISLEMQFDT